MRRTRRRERAALVGAAASEENRADIADQDYRSFLGGSENRVGVVRLDDDSVITVEPKSEGHQVLSLVGSDDRGRFLHNGAAAYRIT